MGIDWWILGFCGVVWLAHVVAIARFRRKSLVSYAICGDGDRIHGARRSLRRRLRGGGGRGFRTGRGATHRRAW